MCYTTKAKHLWPYRLAVRTAPSHGANSGSSPDKVTNETHALMVCVFRCCPIGKDDETDIRVRKNTSVYTRVFFFERSESPR